MSIGSRALTTLITSVAILAGAGLASAATLEEAKVRNWVMNAYTDDKTGAFEHCTMTVPYKNNITLIFSINGKYEWKMGLHRDKWLWKGDKSFVATIHVDSDKRKSEVVEGTVISDSLLGLSMPDSTALFNSLRAGRILQVSLPKQERFEFRLDGTSDALTWLQKCVKRYENYVPTVAKKPRPANDDGEKLVGLRSHRDDLVAKPKPGYDVPAVTTKPKTDDDIPSVAVKPPKTRVTREGDADRDSLVGTRSNRNDIPTKSKPVDKTPTNDPTIEVKNDKPVTKPLVETVDARPTDKPQTDKPKSDDAKGIVPEPPNNRAIENRVAATLLLPHLMEAISRTDYRILEAKDAPERHKKADLVFTMQGLTGVVFTTDFATAQLASSTIVASDVVNCAGTFNSGLFPPVDGRVDIEHAFTECVIDGKSVIARYTTLSRSSGGFFIVGIIDDGAVQANDGLQKLDQGIVEAALRVSGKY